MDTLTRKGEKSPFLFFPQNPKTQSLNPLSKEKLKERKMKFHYQKDIWTKQNPLSKDYLEEYPKEYLEKANPLSKENLREYPKEYLLTYYKTI